MIKNQKWERKKGSKYSVLDTEWYLLKKMHIIKKNDIITLVTSFQCLLFKFIPYKSLLCKFLFCNKQQMFRCILQTKPMGKGLLF